LALVVAVGIIIGGSTGADRSFVLMALAVLAIPGVVGAVRWLIRPRLDLPAGIVPLSLMFGVMHGLAGYALFGGFLRNSLLAAGMSAVAFFVARARRAPPRPG
jgi:hypothetical protein